VPVLRREWVPGCAGNAYAPHAAAAIVAARCIMAKKNLVHGTNRTALEKTSALLKCLPGDVRLRDSGYTTS